ncbi:B12-binding domain-containing radical SAM protein [bacterium]|nr:B12-binding domain-containing radical SAM protein [bacterium]
MVKIGLVAPGWTKSSVWGYLLFRFPVLSLPTLAAVTPPEHTLTFWDDNIENVQEGIGDEQLIAISVMTPLAPRAYALADYFRARGKTVVLGGVHPTFCPDEALEHADAIVVGEAEQTWPLLLKDFESGTLEQKYQATALIDGALIPAVDRSVFKGKKYFFTNLLQTTRGCPYDCEFCSVTSFYGGSYRVRPLEHVRAELDTIARPGSFIFIVDDNILGLPRYSKQLFELLKEYRYKWLSHASINLAFKEDLLASAAKSGCYGLFVGLETLDDKNLDLMGKRVNKVAYYREALARFHDAGIGILGSFVVGYDHDGPESFENIYEFCCKNKLDGGLFTILTPFPGTRVRQRLADENRLLTSDWNDYDMEHVVYQPKKLSAEQLYDGFRTLTRQFHSVPSLVRRLLPPRRSFQFFGPGNLGFKIAWGRKFRGEYKQTRYEQDRETETQPTPFNDQD